MAAAVVRQPGEEFALPARILPVTDAYAALREVRSYEPVDDHATAIAVIIANEIPTGMRRFDPLAAGGWQWGKRMWRSD